MSTVPSQILRAAAARAQRYPLFHLHLPRSPSSLHHPSSLSPPPRPHLLLRSTAHSSSSPSPVSASPRASASSVASPMDGQGASAAVEDTGMDAVQRRLMFEDEAFSVFLFNSKYELLLQQRSATKVTFPKVWTNTCCSHPLYRESELIEEDFLGVRNAAQRKLLDELGIPAEHLPVDEFVPLGRMLYKAPSDGKWGEHELDYLLFIVRDVDLHPNPDEVADAMYVNRDKLKELVKKADAQEDGIKLSPWFRLVVDNFLPKWWAHVEQRTLQDVADMKTIHKLT